MNILFLKRANNYCNNNKPQDVNFALELNYVYNVMAKAPKTLSNIKQTEGKAV